jgi:CRISPR-associated protein Cas5t
MVSLEVEVPFASCRKSFARSFAETYPVPPPATVYGMLLSLVGERFRRRHEGVRLAFAYRGLPQIAVTLRKLTRYKYGVPSKQSKLGNAPDYIETLCGIRIICWLNSNDEFRNPDTSLRGDGRMLEARVIEAIRHPEQINRYGVLCLGLSDDAVNDIQLCDIVRGQGHGLHPCDDGDIELPTWVDHVGAIRTIWRRYRLDLAPIDLPAQPSLDEFTQIVGPSAK